MLGPVSGVAARHGLAAVVAVLASLALPLTAGAQAVAELTTHELQQDIHLLRLLARPALQAEELQAFATAAADVDEKRQALQQAREDPALKAALEQLREALLAGQPDEQIQAIEEQAAPVRARLHQAEEAMFAGVEQVVAGLLAGLPEPVLEDLLRARMGDPVEGLVGALHESRHIPPAEFDNWLQAVSRELSMAVAHGNAQAAEASRAEIEKLLNTTRQMTNPQMEAQAETLEGQARAIAAAADQTQDPDRRAGMVREMLFDLLINPRLHAVLQAKLARG